MSYAGDFDKDDKSKPNKKGTPFIDTFREDITKLEEIFKIIRSRPHGQVAATLSSLIKLGLHTLIDS